MQQENASNGSPQAIETVNHAKNENEKDTQIENHKLNLSLSFAQEKISLLENEIQNLKTIIALLQKEKV